MPVDFTTVNADFGTGAAADREHLAYLCEHSDVLLLQEVKNINVARLLPPGWSAIQDRRDPGRAGVAIAYRRDRVQVTGHDLVVGTRPWWAGRRVRMLTRWILVARLNTVGGESFYAMTAHLPPQRFKHLQPRMMRRLRRLGNAHPRAVLGADLNQPHRRAAAYLGLKAHGEGIDGILTGSHIRTIGHVTVRRFGKRAGLTDHPTVTVRLTDAARKKVPA